MSHNSNLATITMNSLSTVGGALTISTNTRLVTLEMAGLRRVAPSVGADVLISDNVRLNCDVIETLVCALDPNPGEADALRNDSNNDDVSGENCSIPNNCIGN